LSKVRFAAILGLAFLICLSVMAVAPLIGTSGVDPVRAFRDVSSLDHQILVRARIPRVVFGALVGGTLALAGVVFQGLLRNPLASPFTLGVSGGASLGAVIAILAGWEAGLLGFSALSLSAFLGASAVVGVVYLLSQVRRRFSPTSLLLAGVVLNYMCAALILLIHYFSNFTKSFLMMRWMMGGLDIYDYGTLLGVLPFLGIGLPVLVYSARFLNALSVGEDWAVSKGVPVRQLVLVQYLAASLATGAVVAHSGPIGFVGLIVPHVLRLVIGSDHRLLVPVSFFAGGAFLVVCDTISRTVLAPTEIPVGIFTSLLGGPFFLWLLLRRKGEFFG